jgi:hypothetical protein
MPCFFYKGIAKITALANAHDPAHSIKLLFVRASDQRFSVFNVSAEHVFPHVVQVVRGAYPHRSANVVHPLAKRVVLRQVALVPYHAAKQPAYAFVRLRQAVRYYFQLGVFSLQFFKNLSFDQHESG